jgi:alpha-mannosidase
VQLLVEQLRHRLVELDQWLALARTEPAEVRLVRIDDPDVRLPDFDDRDAPLLEPGGDWREPLGGTVWLRFMLRRPTSWPASETALVAEHFGTQPLARQPRIGLDLQRMQGMLYLDGSPYHGLDQYHRLIYLPAGPDFHFAANVWTGLAELEWQPAPVFRLVRAHVAAEQLGHDLTVLTDALRTLPPSDAARPELERLAESVLLAIDWSDPGSPTFRASLERAHGLVADALPELGSAPYEPTLIAAGHAHIDCAWLWPIAQTRQKVGRTWSTALRLMERFPEFQFLASSPLQYEMLRESFPETYAGVRERVAEGRWEPVGGMWVEADCNLPDGESLARQMLIGTRYFERAFGLETRVAWLPDSFGFSWALPTLLAAAGIPYFVTHKLSWSQTNRIPHDTFRWRGPDGREVLAHFLCTPSLWPGEHTTYNGTLLPSIARGAWARFQDRELQQELLVAFGHGDGGGGPTIGMIEQGRRLLALPGFPRVRMGRADEFFDRLADELSERRDVPLWDGELYLEYHRGTYTGQARQKLRNALSQRLYHAAELFAATARAQLGMSYPSAELDEGWRLILTNQFHDILPGSAISSVYVDAEADYRRSTELGEAVLERATSALARSMELGAESLVVFNPAPYPSADYVEVDGNMGTLGLQTTAEGRQLVYCAEVPAHGYRVMRDAAPAGGNQLRVSTEAVETPFWRIELTDAGRIRQIWDNVRQRAVLPTDRAGNRLVVFEDKPLTYDAWDIDVFYQAKSHEVDQLDDIRVVESGPERATLELRWRYGERTTVRQRMQVYARVPRVDFVTDVEWQERQALLRVAFPTRIRNRRATYEIQFGTIDRPTHRNTSWEEAAFEVPAQRWVDLSDAHTGVALLADCKHGYSAQEDTLWLSLLKGAIDPDPDADRGSHHFTYSLLPHGPGLDDVRRAAYALTRPLVWRREPAHPGSPPASFALVELEPSQLVVVETVKWAEDEDALILRLYEAAGGATAATLRFGLPPEHVDAVDLLERNPRPLVVEGNAVHLELGAREVRTLRVSFSSER